MTVKRKNMLSNIPWWVTSGMGAVESCYGSTNGYIRFTNGLKIIWGATNTIKFSDYWNDTYSFTYHTPFTNTVMWGICSIMDLEAGTVLANCTTSLGNMTTSGAVASIDLHYESAAAKKATGKICYLIIGSDSL